MFVKKSFEKDVGLDDQEPQILLDVKGREYVKVEIPPYLDTATKYDGGKTDWAIMPISAMEDIIEVLKFGEKKYARGNFAAGAGLSYTRIINSLLRHIFAFMRGEDRDPESGLHHIAHAGCNIVFLLYYIRNKDKYNSNDDRLNMII